MTLRDELIADAQALLAGPTNRDGAAQGLGRRAVIQALGLGYAAAVSPIQAQTAISTTADGLVAGPVTIDVNGFAMPAYRSAPAGKTGLPVVLVLSEIFGVHEYIADVTRRLAHAGYLAVAPELFVRQGNARGYTDIPKLMAEVVSKVPDAQVMADLDATLAWALAHGGDARRVAVTGFCWGGRQTWLYAAHQPQVKAAVAWYGRLVGAASALTPRHPVEVAASLHAPVLGLYGAADTGIGQDTVETMKQALAAAKAAGNAAAGATQFVVYPDAPHAFHADYRPSYRQGPAEDGWKRLLGWLADHGVGA